MFFFLSDNCPDLILNNDKNEDINILVGPNGIGKSTTLNELAKFHIEQDNNVLAISNTIYDKFSFRKNPKAHKLKSNYGKSMLKNIFTQIVSRLADKDSNIIENIRKILNYIKFELKIEFSIEELSKDFEYIIHNSNEFDPEQKNDIIYFLKLFSRERVFSEIGISHIYRLDLSSRNLDTIKDIFYIKYILFEKQLINLKILKKIDFILYKGAQRFSLNSGSSGELSLIASFFFISLNIKEDSIILIDEPENSLHPKWQVEYIKNLLDLFYLYRPKIIIATHSPLIINGGEVTTKNLNIFKGDQFKKFTKKEKEIKNVEEIYEDYFNITTPENRFISEDIVNKMNKLTFNELSLEDFESYTLNLIKNSYDDKQKNALNEIIKLGKEIKMEINNDFNS